MPSSNSPFHGIFQNEGRVFSNWGGHRTTKPAVYVEPISYADVQDVARDAKRFPSPVGPGRIDRLGDRHHRQ